MRLFVCVPLIVIQDRDASTDSYLVGLCARQAYWWYQRQLWDDLPETGMPAVATVSMTGTRDFESIEIDSPASTSLPVVPEWMTPIDSMIRCVNREYACA
jgi:hypothetical protein